MSYDDKILSVLQHCKCLPLNFYFGEFLQIIVKCASTPMSYIMVHNDGSDSSLYFYFYKRNYVV